MSETEEKSKGLAGWPITTLCITFGAMTMIRESWAWAYAAMIGVVMHALADSMPRVAKNMKAELSIAPRWVLPVAVAVQGFLMISAVSVVIWVLDSTTGWGMTP